MSKKIFNNSGKGRSSVILLFAFLIISLGAINCSRDSSSGNGIPAASTVEAPTFSPVAGTYNTDQSITIATATEGAAIYYTTDGSAPTNSSAEYAVAISVAGHGTTMTIKAIAIKSGTTDNSATEAVYTINYDAVAMPTFSPAAGRVSSGTVITISSTTAGANFYYTTDSSTPACSGTGTPGSSVTVSSEITIQAIACLSGMTNSAVAAATFTINTPPGQVVAPTFSVPTGTYTSSQTVTLSTITSGASIKYTTDGSDPKTTGTATTTTSVDVDQSMTVRAYAFKSGMTDSFESSAVYTLLVADPIFTRPAGTYNVSQNVTISTITADATIRYTTDESNPAPSYRTVYSSPVSVSDTITIKAIAYRSGMADSGVVSAAYTIKHWVAVGDLGTVVYSTDDGVNWTSGTSGTTNGLYDIAFEN